MTPDNLCPTLFIRIQKKLPERDGVEALLELRTHQPQIKIIVISGDAAEFLPIVEDLGANRAISKPFKNQEVLDAVNELLHSH